MAPMSAAPLVAATAATALAWAHVVGAQHLDGCAGGQCDQEVDDGSALISIHRMTHKMETQHGGQRGDDWIPDRAPPVQKGRPFKEQLPIPTPLPPPNPLNNPFIANYTPMNCLEETWPFFADVEGTWVGHGGQNFISLPQVNARPMGKMFIVQVNNYSEETTFEPIVGGVLNRGYLDAVQVNPMNQSDQVLMGILYTQKVMDNDLTVGIHEENGQILHKSCHEVNANITDPWNVLRQGAIPHGSQPMGFGNMTVVETPNKHHYLQMLLRVRQSYEFSVQPFVPGCGPQAEQQMQQSMGTAENTVRLSNNGPLGATQCCIGTSNYMRGMDQCPMTGCPEPIDTLTDAVKGLNVIKYVQLNMTTQKSIPPYVPAGMWTPDIQGGGVQNTAFVNLNAMAESRSFKNLVWLLTVQSPDGSTYKLMQYIQTVNMKFLAKGPGCPDQVWPHVDANTLRRMGPSPTPAPTPAPAPTPKEPGRCYTLCCDCPGTFKEKWCDMKSAFMGPWCSNSEANCHTCMGKWCPGE